LPGLVKPTSGSSYSYTDNNISQANARTIYYKIKQTEKTGSTSYTIVRSLHLGNGKNIILYPNPTISGFYLQIPDATSASGRISLQLKNAMKQVVDKRDIPKTQASNYYFDVQNKSLDAGTYFIEIYNDGKLLESKTVLLKK